MARVGPAVHCPVSNGLWALRRPLKLRVGQGLVPAVELPQAALREVRPRQAVPELGREVVRVVEFAGGRRPELRARVHGGLLRGGGLFIILVSRRRFTLLGGGLWCGIVLGGRRCGIVLSGRRRRTVMSGYWRGILQNRGLRTGTPEGRRGQGPRGYGLDIVRVEFDVADLLGLGLPSGLAACL